MRVTFVVRSLATGGAERQVVATSRLLAEAGHDVRLVVLSSDLSLATPLTGTKVRLVVIDKVSRWPTLNWIRRFRRVLREATPDIVCPWMPAEGLLTWLFAAGAQRRRILWSVRTSHLDLSAYDRITALVFQLHRRLARRGSGLGVVFNSFAGADSYGIRPDGVIHRIIWNAIDFDAFRPDPSLGRKWLREMGFSVTMPLVASIGRISPEKDHLAFIRAAYLVSQEAPSVHFAIAGGGAPAATARLVDAIREHQLDSVFTLLGNRSDVSAILNAARVVVSSSRCGEGVQNALAEAMACGRPIVATNVGDAARFLARCDVLVPPGDVRQLADAILKQLNMDNDEHAAERLTRARSCFSPARMRMEWDDCIRSVSRMDDEI
ncbi:MAG: hypothetical protein AMXMBFR8_12040 [Nevskiales bacterium]